MVIQLHENDLDGEFLFGQDSRIILAKKLVDRPGLIGPRASRGGHRRLTSSSRDSQNRRIEHLFSNLNISNHQNRKTSLRVA